ncbi:DsrE family protein [Thiomicrospira sp. WB1]|uniref:DsrE family protein n=1 Tax=Thiomicrospira sp. WB1 TaxID=1685380 RepID=UPI000748C5C6|nr:DsrE family protein [Thiomicrospira sp. WB1]KUJ72676.1 hypothetical protein AVO41_02425 [Thiomicrospira sp. WB1]
MTEKQKTTSQEIHAYLDGELSSHERQRFEKNMALDPALRAEVCELRKIKQQMLEHYRQVPVPPSARSKKPYRVSYWATAASVLIAVTLGGVWWANAPTSGHEFSGSSLVKTDASNSRILLHIDSNQPDRTQALLQKASTLLQANKTNEDVPPIQIEIVANDKGVDLFEQDNQNREAIIGLLAQYDNLKLIACQRALERRAAKGESIKLIDGVKADKPAIDEIVHQMQQGWSYYKF